MSKKQANLPKMSLLAEMEPATRQFFCFAHASRGESQLSGGRNRSSGNGWSFIRLGRRAEDKVQREKTVSIGPAKGEKSKPLQVTPDVVVMDPGKQLNHLRTGPVVSGIINDQHFLSFFTGQDIEESSNDGHQIQHEPAPVVFGVLEEVVRRILLESQIGISHNPLRKVYALKWQ